MVGGRGGHGRSVSHQEGKEAASHIRVDARAVPSVKIRSLLRSLLCCLPTPFASATMNGTQTRHARPPPAGVTPPPAPVAAPPAPPNHTHPPAAGHKTNGTSVNGSHAPATKSKKKAAEQPVDPSQMYETLKNRIAALEEEEVHEEEEERQIGAPHSHLLFAGRVISPLLCSRGGAEVCLGHGRERHTCEIY